MNSRSITAGFDQSYKAYPTAEAVIDIGGSYTYAELEDKSNRLADRLIAMGLGGMRVAVILPRTRDFVLTALAVCKAGCAYVPIEPGYPADRVKSIYEDADFKAIITERGALKQEVREVCQGIAEDHIFHVREIADGSNVCEHIDRFNIDDECVIIYTSGSTGKPKGVIHSGHFWDLDSIIDKIGYKGQRINFASLARFTFLASQFIGLPLLTGGAFYVVNEEESINLGAMADIISRHNIDGVFMPPKLAYTFFNMHPDNGAKFVFMAGEAMLQVPDTSAALFNLYGATEAGAMLMNRVHKGDKAGLMGVPIYDDSSIYLIDDKGSILTGNNQIGEFCIASPAQSMGYSNLPELNREKFVTCPDDPAKVMFRTADLMERDQDGDLIFHGRKDNMVKVGGYRIELGEVESHLMELGCIQECACAARSMAGTDNLICYYVKDPEYVITESELRDKIASKVPHYMVPSIWIELERMPRNANGKVDRKALPDPGLQTRTQMVAAATTEEAICLKVARKLLPDIEFGVTDDLESVGLTSLKSMEYVAELEKLGLKFSVGDVMRHRNIRKLLSSNRRLCYFYRDYDESKPVLVCTQGILYTNPLINKYDAWSEYYNVFAFDMISQEQFNMIFREDNIDEVAGLYADLIDLNMPEGARVAGFIGFSWGGDLATHTALMWHETYDRDGDLPFVVLGDSYTSMAEPGKVITDEMVQALIAKHHPDENTLDNIKRRNIVTLLNMDRDIDSEHYAGRAIYLNTMREATSESTAKKLDIVNKVFSDIEIHDYPELEHNELFTKDEMVPVLTDILKSQLG